MHDVIRQIEEPGLRLPGFRLVRADAKLNPRDYTTDLSWRPTPFTGTAQPARVVAEFDRGATVVLQGLHLTRKATAVYCRELEARLGHPVQANAYSTPRRSQGLPVHHDTHDVFVLQVGGTKRWLVYDPVLELPLRDQRYRPELGAPGDVVLDVVLQPGDTLYLPRGWMHEALTSDEDSLHLTVGVTVYTWFDAFRAAVERCAEDVEFRRAPSGDARELVERLAARLGPGEVASEMRDRLVRTRRPILAGQLEQLRAVDAIDGESVVERRPTVIASFDGGRLSFEGRRLSFPKHAWPEVEALVAATGPLRLGDLPGRLDSAGRTVLARRLVREGFLLVKTRS